MIEYVHGEGGSVNVNFVVADVDQSASCKDAGWTVVDGPHGSFVTRGRVAKPTGGSLELGAFERRQLDATDKRRTRHEGSGAD